jgi:hypothetical protein
MSYEEEDTWTLVMPLSRCTKIFCVTFPSLYTAKIIGTVVKLDLKKCGGLITNTHTHMYIYTHVQIHPHKRTRTGYRAIRATHGVSAGCWYFELEVRDANKSDKGEKVVEGGG